MDFVLLRLQVGYQHIKSIYIVLICVLEIMLKVGGGGVKK